MNDEEYLVFQLYAPLASSRAKKRPERSVMAKVPTRSALLDYLPQHWVFGVKKKSG
jgi:hypothetical protein